MIFLDTKSQSNAKQFIRFSATCDIGTASFKYDMRRLTEILAFPKAWYRKAIWKRMFIGEQTISAILSDQEDNDQSDGNDDDIRHVKPAVKTLKKQDTISKRESLRLNLQDVGTRRKFAQPHEKPVIATIIKNPWETLILFSVNLSKLNVTMNMGNVMGNTSWLTKGLHSDGRISIDSTGRKHFKIGLDLEGSTLDAKGGIIGGVIELSQINSQLCFKEDVNKEPEHVLFFGLHTFEKRLDYMGTSILMMRISDLEVVLRDEWRIDKTKHFDIAHHPTKRPALIFIHGDLTWDQFQMLISKSTTPDILKTIAKLEEFFTQQFHSSKRVFSSLQTKPFNRQSSQKGRNIPKRSASNAGASSPIPNETTQASNLSNVNSEAKHHRHWQNVLQLVSGVQLSTLPYPLPQRGTILGGNIQLSGKHVSLACFYGINFRSKSWATFSLRQPSISFSTEAQNTTNENSLLDTHIVQHLSLTLGRNLTEQSLHQSMGTVCKISRNVMFPPQFRNMHEWFQYAFSTNEIDEVDRFPVLISERLESSGEVPQASPHFRDRRASVSPKPEKGREFHHNQELIFAFPSMQLELKTEHLQASKTPSSSDVKPAVDCTFVSDFDDHIFVAVDAEAYFFLHELISSYIKEKQVNYQALNKNQSPALEKSNKNIDIEAMQKDWREYVCHTWHLEPTVR